MALQSQAAARKMQPGPNVPQSYPGTHRERSVSKNQEVLVVPITYDPTYGHTPDQPLQLLYPFAY